MAMMLMITINHEYGLNKNDRDTADNIANKQTSE